MRIKRNMIPYITSYVIGTGLMIGGILSVPKKEQCDITNTYHVHLFTKDIGNTKINKWLQREKNSSYTKQDDFIPTTSFDLEAFDRLNDHHLFDGKDNINFINYQIETNRDYMMFYYYYEETYYEKDSEEMKLKELELILVGQQALTIMVLLEKQESFIPDTMPTNLTIKMVS